MSDFDLNSPENRDTSLDFGDVETDQEATDSVAQYYTEALLPYAQDPQLHRDELSAYVERIIDKNTVTLISKCGCVVDFFKVDFLTQLSVYKGYAVTEVVKEEFEAIFEAIVL